MQEKSKEQLENEILELRQKIAAMEDEDKKNKQVQLELLRLNQILDTTSDFVATSMLDRKLFYLNKAGRKLVGLNDDADIRKIEIQDVHPDWAFNYILNTGIPAALKNGIWRGETALLNCSSGKEIPVSQVIMYHESPKGEFKYLSTIMRDITEQKRTQRELKESERFLKEAQTIAHLGHWNLNPETEEVSGSDELFRILGLDRDKLTLGAFVEVVHPDDREYDLSHIHKGLEQGEPWDIEHRLLLKNGTLKHVHAKGEAITDETGKPVQLVGTIQDITLRKQEEEEVRRTREKYHNIFQAVPNLMATSSLVDGLYSEVNDEFVEAIGFPREEIIGKTPRELGVVTTSEYRERLKSDIEKYGRFRNVEIAIQLKDGKLHDGVLSGAVFDFDGPW